MLNELQKQDLQGIAALGRNEDTFLAHVAPDEMVVPAQVLKDDPLLNTYIRNSISKYGVDPNQFIVGNGDMDLNPMTGLPEFGFLSKVVKKVKKAVKKALPEAPKVSYSYEDLKDLSSTDLKNLCKKLKVPSHKRKPQMIENILNG